MCIIGENFLLHNFLVQRKKCVLYTNNYGFKFFFLFKNLRSFFLNINVIFNITRYHYCFLFFLYIISFICFSFYRFNGRFGLCCPIFTRDWNSGKRGIGEGFFGFFCTMSFNQDDVILSFNSKLLNLIDQFIYIGCNISSTESDINVVIDKALTAIDRLSTIWKSDKIEHKFFLIIVVSVLM